MTDALAPFRAMLATVGVQNPTNEQLENLRQQ